MLALISLSLAIINLFPFLPLDGGHIFWALAEKVRGRAISFRVMERAAIVGFMLVLLLFFIGLSNDIGRLTAARASASARARYGTSGQIDALEVDDRQRAGIGVVVEPERRERGAHRLEVAAVDDRAAVRAGPLQARAAGARCRGRSRRCRARRATAAVTSMRS